MNAVRPFCSHPPRIPYGNARLGVDDEREFKFGRLMKFSPSTSRPFTAPPRSLFARLCQPTVASCSVLLNLPLINSSGVLEALTVGENRAIYVYHNGIDHLQYKEHFPELFGDSREAVNRRNPSWTSILLKLTST